MKLDNIRIEARDSVFNEPLLTIKHWSIGSQSWGIVGRNNSGKAQLFELLMKQVNYKGDIANWPDSIAAVSFGEQQALVAQELKNDQSDILDELDPGTLVAELLQQAAVTPAEILPIAEQFGLDQLLQQGFRSLSTGETRKVLLARALLRRPQLLLLEDPFDGLDVQARQQISRLLEQLAGQGVQLLLMVDRPDDLPDWLAAIAVFANRTLLVADSAEQVRLSAHWLTLKLSQAANQPPPISDCATSLPAQEPVFQLRRGRVSYGDHLVIDGLDWSIQQGEHWRLIGPNGSGKSTLLKVICGDHPQCYSNDIRQFGIQRGNGESIWDIKRHIGMVSAELQLNYRARVNALTVVLSGYFDSIGVYRHVSQHQKSHAMAWLQWFHAEHLAAKLFHQLSYGEQRLILVIRALVKSPLLLILDEPLQGLDEANAQVVLTAVNRIIESGHSQLLYVSHREEPGLHCDCRALHLPVAAT
ncbi:molybdate ABC transporter ATP-binding protein ModF [Neiella sp. HB171785]|uniref:Molybdate ABC transporter ATP-binding protein ModF n=1 Tax=Neiella litorisoli TaxID=2771431 RepID=A0A8J6QT69_9GAMM|nr:molybdate ABC transporter ATP-binding protein ModF [Neiella litorisoli]MBD1388507.1 molybdate ABC transporter ATP-binding protein ModF [Neiella litorisoli]